VAPDRGRRPVIIIIVAEVYPVPKRIEHTTTYLYRTYIHDKNNDKSIWLDWTILHAVAKSVGNRNCNPISKIEISLN
jgi:hypothetical protein